MTTIEAAKQHIQVVLDCLTGPGWEKSRNTLQTVCNLLTPDARPDRLCRCVQTITVVADELGYIRRVILAAQLDRACGLVNSTLTN